MRDCTHKLEGYRNYGKEGCCPKEWDNVTDVTGNYEMDGSIMRCKNSDAHSRLSDHIATDVAYKINTAYGFSPVD